jgi:hypothetical protein
MACMEMLVVAMWIHDFQDRRIRAWHRRHVTIAGTAARQAAGGNRSYRVDVKPAKHWRWFSMQATGAISPL